MTPDFHELFDLEGLSPGEQEQLRRAHALLVEAGPPPELPAGLERAPVLPESADVIRFPGRTRRRGAVALLLAAAVAVVAFGAGYATGDHNGGSPSATRVVSFKGSNAVGSLRVGTRDAAGNWPIDFQTAGLPALKEKYAYYELFLVLHGKPRLPCGGFNVLGVGGTSVHFDVPYKIKSTSRWVVTAVDHKHPWPGRTVMT